MANANFDQILTTTLNNHREQFVDNVFKARPLAFWLKDNDRVRLVGGGAKIVEPLVIAKNSTVAGYSKFDTLDTTPQNELTAAEYPWRQVAGTVAIAGIEEAQNSGAEQILNLIEAKVSVARESITAHLNTMFHNSDGVTDNSGTGGYNFAKEPYGLPILVGDATATVGGIDASVDTVWQSSVDDPGAGTALTLADMTTKFLDVSVGGDTPDLILTGQTLYEAYEAKLQPNMRYSDSKMADGGFLNLMFKSAPVVFDSENDANTMWFLNSRYLKLVGHRDRWFTVTPFIRPSSQDARYAQILTYLNLTCSNRSRQGALKNRTA